MGVVADADTLVVSDDFGFEGDVPEVSEVSSFDKEAWYVRGAEFASRDTKNRWALADWLVEGEPHFSPTETVCGVKVGEGSVYEIAARITGLSRKTLWDLATTARRMPTTARSVVLSFSHHRVLVNSLPDADETTLKEWVKRAEDEKMSRTALEQALRTGNKSTFPEQEQSFRVTIPTLNVYETLKDFADADGVTVGVIAARWLVKYSTMDEVQEERQTQKAELEERRYQKRRAVGISNALFYDPAGLQT
jgi:hypothetical protein